MITNPLLSDPRVARGGSNVPVPKHLPDVFQRHSIVEHHVRKRMARKVRVQWPFNPTDHRKFFQVDIVPEVAINGDQTVTE